MTAPRPSRRRLLAAVAGVATAGGSASLAGCLGGGGDRPDTTVETTTDEIDTLTEVTTERSPTATPTDATSTTRPKTATISTTTTATADDLDLREANVTAVEFEESDGGYRFSVTLLHDDDGEDGYANWWQVESLDGTRLGRRELLHAHGTREFTRSATVEIPDDVACVVVRGHDRTHGYGGQAVLVTLETGATRVVRQGPEPRSFAGADCP